MTVAQQTDFDRIAVVRCEHLHATAGCTCLIAHCQECPSCDGTGYRFPWLWQKRECIEGHTFDNATEKYRCWAYSEDCGGAKAFYVLIEGEGERLLGLLRVAREMEYLQWISYTASQYHVEIRDDSFSADTLLDALSSALMKALEA